MAHDGNGNILRVATHVLLITLHLFHGHISADDMYDDNGGQYPAYGTQLSIGAGHQPVVQGYSPNSNPFLQSLYQNNAAYVQTEPQDPPQVYQQNQQAYGTPQVPAAYVPIQQAYTLTYYPTSLQQTTEAPKPGPFVPAPPGQRPYCAKEGQTYCEHVEYYPTKIVLNLLDDDSVDEFLVNEDKLRIKFGGLYNITPSYFYDYSYTTRANGQPLYPNNDYYAHRRSKRQLDDEDEMCPTSESFVTARAAENNDGDWKYVINMPEVDRKLQQLVRVSKCRTTTCRGLCTPPSGSRAVCEQQYVQTRLIALDPSGAKLNNELFKFPHCCLCKITSPN